MSDIESLSPEVKISRGAELAAKAFNEFGPRVCTATKLYERAKKKFKIAPFDQTDFDTELLRLAREHRGLISAKVLK